MNQNQYNWQIQALGTHWQFLVWQVDFKNLTLVELQTHSEQTIQNFEQKYSRFRPNSLVSQLNSKRRLINPDLEILQMLELGEKLKDASGGYFDLCVGQDLIKIGYGHIKIDSQNSIKKNVKDQTSSNFHNNSHIKFGAKQVLLKNSYHLDLGGIGKGFLVDKLAKQFKDLGFASFLINGGGDVFASNQGNDQSVECLLENPFDSSEAIGRIMIKETAIASSSSNRRQWGVGNQTKHHLINPFTGDSKVTTILAVYTQAKNCTHADLGSTAIFVSPPEFWAKIQVLLNLEFLVVFQDGSYQRSQAYSGQLF